MSTTNTTDQVDVRGPRFVAWITTAVLVITLVVSGVSAQAAAVILGVQAVVFAIGAVAGPRRHPYGLVFATLVGPRLGPVREREPVPPLKFAQLVGLVFAVIGAAGFAAGAPLVGLVATGAALVAAFLNAAFGICLGCQLYPLVVHLKPAGRTSEPA
jgi:Ca2+/Na+ antiporter